MDDFYETLLDQAQDGEPKALSERITRDARGSKPKRRRTVAQIINKTESQSPPSPRGNGDHCSPPVRGPPQIWRLKHVLAVTAIGKTQLLDPVAKGLFPPPIKLLETGRSVGWLASEVVEYLERRIAARDQGLPRSDAPPTKLPQPETAPQGPSERQTAPSTWTLSDRLNG
jgi:prophage regulatory protein